MTAPRSPARARAFAFDVGLVVVAWLALLLLENLVVGLAWRSELVAPWEMGHARRYLTPIALGASFPLAVGAVLVARLAAARRARELAALAFAGGAAAAYGISTGRHFASVAARAPFVVAAGLACAAIAYVAARRAPLGRPRTLAAAGAGVACAAWLANAFVLPRLYPAFHDALLVVALGAWAATALALTPGRAARARRALSVAGLVVVTLSLAWTGHAARAVRRDDNLRRVLYEHAPLLGRAVVLAARLAPPAPVDDGGADEAAITAAAVRGGGATDARLEPGGGGRAGGAAGPGARALDWRGRDVVLVTIDALRADHVSAYGYARKTTPNIDRLAAEGARFERAYCATPHTSYSIASLMTGKYMRPLLAIGAGEDSETWPLLLRRYGYQTAAFYPPAVFFIDEQRFTSMSRRKLSFEYYKVEFAKPALRRAQIDAWLAASAKDPTRPRFLWLHLFEPHEPYEMHPEHPFSGDERVDAYDSEIAEADAVVGELVRDVRARSPRAVFIVSADHGEEFGDHGGRYHGTTVYEEQVRVPLVVVGPGVSRRTISTPVQTIDLLPTTLAALDIPMPARVRGHDLGGLLARGPSERDEGLAFAETDEWTMVARGSDRLVCARKAASCTLFDVAKDPGEEHAVTDRPARVLELRRLGAAIERENGRLEGTPWPDALRRAMQGDRDAAEDVAPLLDDAETSIRRAAAKAAFRLRAPELAPQLARAAKRDEDRQVRAWAALALARAGGDDASASGAAGTDAGTDAGADAGADAKAAPAGARGVAAMLGDPDAEIRFAAALVLAERGDARGEGTLVARWQARFGPSARERGELEDARVLLAALAKIRARSASAALAASLGDVRLRPYVVEALGAIGDANASDAVLAAFANERYLHVRPIEARALAALGAHEELRAPLARFAGVPEPMTEAIGVARDRGLLDPARGGASFAEPRSAVDVTLRIAPGVPSRLLVLLAGPGGAAGARASLDGAALALAAPAPDVLTAEIAKPARGAARLELEDPSGVLAVWIVPRADEIPPPPPVEWDAGAGDDPPLP
jgi:arylsulfatase A-like enzyme